MTVLQQCASRIDFRLALKRCVVMDRYSGKKIDIDEPAIGAADEVFAHLQWPLRPDRCLVGRILIFYRGFASVTVCYRPDSLATKA